MGKCGVRERARLVRGDLGWWDLGGEDAELGWARRRIDKHDAGEKKIMLSLS